MASCEDDIPRRRSEGILVCVTMCGSDGNSVHRKGHVPAQALSIIYGAVQVMKFILCV